MSDELAHRLELLRRERADVQALLADADADAERTRAGVSIGFLREQIDALDRQIEALERDLQWRD